MRRLVVCKLFRRQPWAVSRTGFNSRVIEVNLKLEEELRDVEGAQFWHQRLLELSRLPCERWYTYSLYE